MSSAASTRVSLDARTRADRGVFLRARLGQLLAILPLGVWTFVHLWNNLSAFRGADAWQAAVTEYPHPIAQLASAIVVLLPIAVHTVWGIGRLFTARPNNVRYGYFANFKYALQRLSAIGVLLFLGAHIWLAMLSPRLQQGHAEAFAEIAHEMHFHRPTLIVYLLGTLGVSYHLANGLQTFAMGWGLVSTRAALRRIGWISWLAFAVLLAMSWGVVYALYAAAAPAGAALP
jgi:succinate dehydrogenase / fumarate reductase cytochrome b subunit